MTENIRKIGFIGGGNMAEALIKGLRLQDGCVAMMASEPVASRREFLSATYGIETTDDNQRLVKECAVVVLAVKPQIVKDVLAPLAAQWRQEQFLVSILAGVKTADLENALNGQARVVRVMPNTPALVGCGAAAVCGGRNATEEDLQTVCDLFKAVGLVERVSETQMDAVTGLSGSGPAYIYTLIEALADGGVLEGLPRNTALALAAQTVLGGAQMVLQTGEHPAALRDKVCSPGGTTIAGVRALEEGGLRATLIDAVHRASERSRQLGK